MPNLRPDYVGNYTEISAGRVRGEKEVSVTGKELYSRTDLRSDRDNMHLTPAAVTPASSSPPSASAPAKIEIQKSVEFTFTETVEAVDYLDDGLGIRRQPSFSSDRRGYGLGDHFGPEPSVPYYPSRVYTRPYDNSLSQSQHERVPSSSYHQPKKSSPQNSRQRSASGASGNPSNMW